MFIFDISVIRLYLGDITSLEVSNIIKSSYLAIRPVHRAAEFCKSWPEDVGFAWAGVSRNRCHALQLFGEPVSV